MKTSDLKHIIKEALSEDESKAVLDKYKKRYAAVLKSNPKFIKKYSNPDAVIYGMVMNEVKKLREKLGKNSKVGDYIEDFTDSNAPQFKGKSDKKKKQMAVAAFLNKEEQALEEIDNLMNETGQKISKKNMDDYKRLNELVKAALMGPISEKKKDHDGDGDIDSDDYMIARDKAIKKAKGKKVDESKIAPLLSILKTKPEEVGKELAQALGDETDKLFKLFKGMGADDKKAKEMANNPGRALGMRSESLAERIFKELRK